MKKSNLSNSSINSDLTLEILKKKEKYKNLKEKFKYLQDKYKEDLKVKN